MSVKVYVHELKGLGFWVEVEEKTILFGTLRHFILSNGTLSEKSITYPHWVVEDGIFKDKESAWLAANQYADIMARRRGQWTIPVILRLAGGAE